MGNKRVTTKKVCSRVTLNTYEKLDSIKEEYGFKSVYEIIQSLIHCFLRVADPESDKHIEPVPYEIEQMFMELSSAEKHVEFKKPKRRSPLRSLNDKA